MKFNAYENTKIKSNQTIAFPDLKNYLKDKKYTTFDIKLEKITPTKITLNLSTNANFDFFVVENFPFYNGKLTYWNLINKDFNNNTNGVNTYTFYLELQPFLTFTFKEMFNDNFGDILNMHINEFNEFKDYKNLILKEKNYFQNNLFFPNGVNYIIKKNANIIYSKEELRMKNLILNDDDDPKWWTTMFSDKWMILTIKITKPNEINGEASIILPKTSSYIPTLPLDQDNYSRGEQFETETFFIVSPIPRATYKKGYAGSTIKVNFIDSKGTNIIMDIPSLWRNFRNNPNTASIITTDFIPSDLIKWNKIERTNKVKYLELNVPKEFSYQEFKRADISFPMQALTFKEISAISSNVKMITETPLFNWKPETDNWNKKDNNLFKIENSIYLNFAPYKKYKIGMFTETYNSGWDYNLNFNKCLDTTKIFFNRKLNPALNIFELTDDLTENKYFGEIINKIKKNLSNFLYSDEYRKANENKVFGGLGAYLLPTAGLVLAGMGNPYATAAGLGAFALGMAKTYIDRTNMANQPDTIVNASTELTSEFMNGFSSKTLITYELPEYAQYNIAIEFHKFGVHFDNKKITLNNEFFENLINTKKRFNFVKFSTLTTNRVFDNGIINLKETQKLILDKMHQGIHFFNYKNEWNEILKEYTFNYLIKNPVKKES